MEELDRYLKAVAKDLPGAVEGISSARARLIVSNLKAVRPLPESTVHL